MGNERLRGDRHNSFSADLVAAAARDGRGQFVLSTREAAAALGLSERRLRRAIARGELSADRDGAGFRIPADELIRYARQNGLPIPLLPQARVVALPSPADAFTALPGPGSSLIGRAAELASLIALLDDPAVRLVTLTGPGGIGKTRLALAAADLIQDHFPHGAIFIDLSAVSEAEHAVPAIAQALGLREHPGQDQLSQIVGFLRAKDLLLVLDNVEQIIDAAPQIARLSTQAAGVTLLVTSRAPLRVRGERELPVPLLPLPISHATPDELLVSDAGRLFVERAREHDPAFAVDAQSAPVIAEICAHLDGLPLAIELAAARSKTLTPRQLRDRLERRLPLLTGGPRDAPPRHLTMRDAIAWSYDLLLPDEQTLFRRLAVFVGGFTLEAAEASWGKGGKRERGEEDDLSPPVLDRVESLLDQSLLVRDFGVDGETPHSGRGGRGGEPRLRMLETIREFGLEQLAGGGEVADARAAHAHYFLTLAGSVGAPGGLAANQRALDLIAADYANVTAALAWLDERGPAADFVQLVGLLPGYWYANSQYADGSAWLERALVKAEQAAPLDRARVWVGLARFHILHGDLAAAEPYFAAGTPLLRVHGDALETVGALLWRGVMAAFAGDPVLAEVALTEALAMTEHVGESLWRSTITGSLLANLGVAARARGDLDLAEERHEQALHHFQEHGIEVGITGWYRDTGDLARDRGDFPLAAERYQACLARIGERGDMRIVVEALAGIATAATAWNDHRTALLLFAAADAVRERIGIVITLPSDVAATERSLDALRQALPEEVFAATWVEGRAISLEAALANAATVEPPSDMPPVTPPPIKSPLTRREQDVLRLLAAGQTDREIAEALFIGPRTVSWHVSSIMGKLDATTRREAVRQALAEGLV